MTRQSMFQAKKESQPLQTSSLFRRQAAQAPIEEREAAALPVNLGRDFSGIPFKPVHPAPELGPSSISCPFTPERCPFGGVCHACPPKMQAKLKIGQPGDRYEQEADRVAEQVMRMPEPQVQRKCSAPGCKDEEEKKLLQTKPANAGEAGAQVDHPLIQNVLSSPGQPLDAGTRSFMEPRFGQDFSGVRVHVGGQAAESARAVNARAYTVGRDVVFGEGQYMPGSDEGKRLVAHELAHVTHQYRAGMPIARTVVQRKDKPTAQKTAKKKRPELDFRPAKNKPPCACLVFIHHNEENARLMAHWMYEHCRYNLAIVDPQSDSREIKIPAKGKVDPNELFPREIAEECWNDDTQCDKKAPEKASDEELVQRQFFQAIKECSHDFSLPVVGLHNNAHDETTDYLNAVNAKKKPLDLTPIKGKTFNDTIPLKGELPYKELEDWLLKNKQQLGVKEKTNPKKGAKSRIERTPNGLLKNGGTNIFIWCRSNDNSLCYIGDPEHPDRVVWVTNSADFEKMQGAKTNVILQTRVDPSGNSANDLSSLFVFLEDIINRLDADIAIESSSISKAINDLINLRQSGDLTLKVAPERLIKIFDSTIQFLLLLLAEAKAIESGKKEIKLSQLRYINIETPEKKLDKNKGEKRVDDFHYVKATLGAVGLDCCDKNASSEIEKKLQEGDLPKTTA